VFTTFQTVEKYNKQTMNSHTWRSNPEPITSPFLYPQDTKHILVYMVEFWESSTQIPILLGLFSSSGTIIGAETLGLLLAQAQLG
jgi:hypothetical protein